MNKKIQKLVDDAVVVLASVAGIVAILAGVWSLAFLIALI